MTWNRIAGHVASLAIALALQWLILDGEHSLLWLVPAVLVCSAAIPAGEWLAVAVVSRLVRVYVRVAGKTLVTVQYDGRIKFVVDDDAAAATTKACAWVREVVSERDAA